MGFIRCRPGRVIRPTRRSAGLLLATALALLCAPTALAQTEDSQPAADAAQDAEIVAPGRDQARPLDPTEAALLQAYHRIGPNDYLRITLTAGETLSYDRRVDGAGSITLPLVGMVEVEGLTVSRVAEELVARYRVYYIAPHVEVDLLAIGRMQVLIVEEGGTTTIRAVANGTTLFDLLSRYRTGGLLFRRAKVVRGGEELFNRAVESGVGPPPGRGGIVGEPAATQAPNGVIQARTSLAARSRLHLQQLMAEPGAQVFPVDIVQLLRGGGLSEFNLRLRHGDIVYLTNLPDTGVPARAPTRLVAITGVPVAGTYALLPGETLADLLDISGFMDLPELDLRNVVLERRDADGDLMRLILNLDPAHGHLSVREAVELEHRDTVRIHPYLRQVFVMGEVNSPGVYAHNDQWLAQDYIAAAGGAAASANLHEVYIIRPERDLGVELQHPYTHQVNLVDKVRGRAQENYSVLPGDVIFVAHRSRRVTFESVLQTLNTMFIGLTWFERMRSNGNGGDIIIPDPTGQAQ